jgi:hypothetical protein
VAGARPAAAAAAVLTVTGQWDSGAGEPPQVYLQCPGVAAPMLVEALFETRRVAESISVALTGSCRADDYARLRLAEPVVGAAVDLLERTVGGSEASPPGSERMLGEWTVAAPSLSRCLRLARTLAQAWPTPAVAQAALLLQDALTALRT